MCDRCDEPRADATSAFASLVRSATNNLPYDQAEAIWLVDVCDYSYQDAALQVGVAPEVLARRIRSARRDLRRQVAA